MSDSNRIALGCFSMLFAVLSAVFITQADTAGGLFFLLAAVVIGGGACWR